MLIAAGILLLLVYWACMASAEEAPDGDETELPALNLHAGGAVLMDGYTGRVLYEKNGSQVLSMASTTKIMTCILALENGDPEDMVEVSAYAASMPDVQLGIRQGEKYRLGDLLLSLMLESHNDSAVAIAEFIAAKVIPDDGGGQTSDIGLIKAASERSMEESKTLVAVFAEMMNQKAEEIGCEHTYFITPNGLDADIAEEDGSGKQVERTHSTTAEELALIMRYCLSQSEKSDDFISITQTREASLSDETGTRIFSCMNHNRYLDMKEGAISGKTGFTGKAGYCYVGAVDQDGVFLIVALLACGWPPSKNLKWQDMNTLVDYGLENYSREEVSELPVRGGSYLIDAVQGKSKHLMQVETKIIFEPFSLLLKSDEKLSWSWYLEPDTLKKGEIVGEYQVRAGDTVCRTFPLITWQLQEWEKD